MCCVTACFSVHEKVVFPCIVCKAIKDIMLACEGTNRMTVCVTHCLPNICCLLVKSKYSFYRSWCQMLVLDGCISIHHLRCFCSRCLFCLSYNSGDIRHRPTSRVWRTISVTQCFLGFVSYLSLCMPTFWHFYNSEKVMCINCCPVLCFDPTASSWMQNFEHWFALQPVLVQFEKFRSRRNISVQGRTVYL
jgi:hypothetical protein